MRFCSALLGKVVDSLAPSITAILVRGKQASYCIEFEGLYFYYFGYVIVETTSVGMRMSSFFGPSLNVSHTSYLFFHVYGPSLNADEVLVKYNMVSIMLFHACSSASLSSIDLIELLLCFQLTISVWGQQEHVVDKPVSPNDIREILYTRLYPYDPIQAVLQQELIINIGTYITTSPELFHGILKIRIG